MNGDTGNPELLKQILSSASDILRLMREADAENNKANAKLDELNSRPPRNPSEAIKSANEFAPVCDDYAKGLRGIVPYFDSHIADLTRAYTGYIGSVNLETDEGQVELETINKKLKKMIASYKETAGKARVLREALNILAENNHTPQLTQSARNLVVELDRLTSVYEDIETFGLNTLFVIEAKKGNEL